jgi:acetyl-CoA decarbonylase/synthase complex subunit delta
MKYEAPLEKYPVNIRETVLGQGGKAVKIGGENVLPFHAFEGSLPNAPGLALEILDIAPDNWAPEVMAPYEDVLSDPVAWAKKCVEIYGAEILCLRLLSTDPMGQDAPAGPAAETAQRVAEAVDAPLIVWGTGAEDKDQEVLVEVAKALLLYGGRARKTKTRKSWSKSPKPARERTLFWARSSRTTTKPSVRRPQTTAMQS